MSFLEKMRKVDGQLEAPTPDPWRKIIASTVNGVDAMSSAALLDLVGARRTTGNARRLAAIIPPPYARRVPRHRHARVGMSHPTAFETSQGRKATACLHSTFQSHSRRL
jgi:hypothetical protein